MDRGTDLESIDVQTKPRRAVYATGKFAKGELKLVATTISIGFADVEAKVPSNSYVVGECVISEAKSAFAYVSAGKHVFPEGDNEFSLVPFWFVENTHDPTKANVELGEIAVEVSGSVKKTEAKARVIKVPIWTNTKVIQSGEEILHFKAEKTRDASGSVPPPPKRKADNAAPAAKKAKPASAAATPATAPKQTKPASKKV